MCLVIYSPDNQMPWTAQQTTQPPLCRRQNRKSGFCPPEMASKTPCFICLKQSHLDAFTRPHVGLCRSSEQIGKQHDLPGKSQRAAITRSFADAPQLHRAPVWFLSGCSPPTLFFSSHFYHLLISLSISSAFCLFLPFFPCPWLSVSVNLLACLCLFFFLSGALLPFSSHTSSPLNSFTLKYVLVGCVSCENASSDCILHPQSSNKAGVLYPLHFPHLLSYLLYLGNEVLQQKILKTGRPKSKI